MKLNDTATSKDRLLTRQEAADYLNVTLRFVTRCVQQRRVRYIRVGSMVRIPESALEEYIEAHSVPSADKASTGALPTRRSSKGADGRLAD